MRDGRVSDTRELDQSNDWRYTWTGLEPDSVWNVVEQKVPEGYTVSVRKDGLSIVITNTKDEPDKPEEPDLPKTGLLWWSVFPLAGAGALCLLTGLVVSGRNREAFAVSTKSVSPAVAAAAAPGSASE